MMIQINVADYDSTLRQSRISCVKCWLNGELSVRRRNFPRFDIRIPLLHTGDISSMWRIVECLLPRGW